MKKKNELGIVLHYAIFMPPPYTITYMSGVSYENPNNNYSPESKNNISTNTVCKNKFT